MYLNGVTLRVARDNVRAHIPDALALAVSGNVAPEKVVSPVMIMCSVVAVYAWVSCRGNGGVNVVR